MNTIPPSFTIGCDLLSQPETSDYLLRTVKEDNLRECLITRGRAGNKRERGREGREGGRERSREGGREEGRGRGRYSGNSGSPKVPYSSCPSSDLLSVFLCPQYKVYSHTKLSVHPASQTLPPHSQSIISFPVTISGSLLWIPQKEM